MRYNVFAQEGGAGYGVLVCSVCNKSVTFELEHQVDVSTYGEGARALSMLGSPKPPNVERKKAAGDAEMDDKTL
jgi:hypothetical protein